MERTLALAASLVVALMLAWFQELPPRPLSTEAAPERFSAGRAMEDIRVIARTPHPVGSAANAAVRDHLIQRMTALGLSPQVQTARAFETRTRRGETLVQGGRIENVIGVLPGRDRQAPAVALMAHYDSVAGSPGAADDATGVAAALEVARALKARGTPARDVILVITDGEEAGLLGARAFFAEHPLAKRVGFILNLESRGGGGRVQMFETGARNGETIDLFQRTAVRPVSSSLAVFLYDHMPNDTDFTVAKAAGVAGLNYAFIGRQFDYHSPTSTPKNLRRRTVQDMGAQALSAAAGAAFAERLPAEAPDLVYAQTLRGGVIAYPPAVGWFVLTLASGLMALGAVRARRAGTLNWRDVAQGVGASVYVLAAGAALLRLARRATGAEAGFLEFRVLLAQVTLYETALILVALGAVLFTAAALARGKARQTAAALALGAGMACSAFGGLDPIGLGLGVVAALMAVATFGRAAGTPGAWAGLLITGLAAALALQIAAPATAFLVAWPLVVAGLAAAISALGAKRELWITIAVALLAAVGLGWIGGFAHGLFLGMDMPELLAATAWLAAFLIWPFAHPRIGGAGRITAILVLVAGLALTVAIRVGEPWSARHPRANMVAYEVDADTGRSYRVSPTPDIAPWTEAVLKADGGTIVERDGRPLWRGAVRAAPAASIAAPPTALTLTASAEGRRILAAEPPPGARILSLRVRSTAPLSEVALNGLPVKILAKAGEWTTIRWEADPDGLDLSFRAAGPGEIEVRHAAVTEAWPAAAKPLPKRPKTLMAFDISDSTVVTGAAKLAF